MKVDHCLRAGATTALLALRMPVLACALALLAPPLGSAGAKTYAVDAAASAVTVHVGKTGVFKFAGHEHEVAAPRLEGQVVADAVDISRSSVAITFDAPSLRVTGKGEPPGDVPDVQAKMVGADLLDVGRFPAIVFRSKGATGRETTKGTYEIEITGDLEIHGVKAALTLPVHVEIEGDSLTARGQAVLRQTDFGLRPVSVAGVVKVKNEIALEYRIVARAGPAAVSP